MFLLKMLYILMIVVFGTLVFLGIYSIIQTEKDKSFCKEELGEDAFANSFLGPGVQEGYVYCCIWVYEDGLGTKDCKAIKEGGGKK